MTRLTRLGRKEPSVVSKQAIQEIFKAYDVRGVYPDQLNEQTARKIGEATGRYFTSLAQPATATNPVQQTIAVSRDMRPHSPKLAQSLIDGLRATGMDVIDLGMCDTSFIYFAVNHLKCAGGIQVTASHNPMQYNGFKFSGHQAKPIGSTTGLDDIRDFVIDSLGDQDASSSQAKSLGKLETQDLWPQYHQHILKCYQPGKRKLKVVVDASNAMAGKMVPVVFEGVDGLEMVKLNFQLSDDFAHDPDPLVDKNMLQTQQAVKEHQADFGACFDGDADRCIFTDEKGQIIRCDHLTALLTQHFLLQSPGSGVAYDIRSSRGVAEAIQKFGGVPRCGRVGHVFMKGLMRQHDCVFGGELSGHFYFRDNFYADSGAIAFAAVASILSQHDQPISQLIEPYRRYPKTPEVNFLVPCDDPSKYREAQQAVIDGLEVTYAQEAKLDKLDGITVDAWDTQGWWYNVRASNTQPILRLNAEAKDDATLKQLRTRLEPDLGTPDDGTH